jgi:cytochrome c
MKSSGQRGWTDDHLVDYLSTGLAAKHGTATGPMAEAVDKSQQFLSRSDIKAIVVYLRSVPSHASSPGLVVRQGGASRHPDHGSDPTREPLGEQIFAEACFGCHAWSGGGAMLPTPS